MVLLEMLAPLCATEPFGDERKLTSMPHTLLQIGVALVFRCRCGIGFDVRHVDQLLDFRRCSRVLVQIAAFGNPATHLALPQPWLVLARLPSLCMDVLA